MKLSIPNGLTGKKNDCKMPLSRNYQTTGKLACDQVRYHQEPIYFMDEQDCTEYEAGLK
jgi:hypothetical protein